MGLRKHIKYVLRCTFCFNDFIYDSYEEAKDEWLSWIKEGDELMCPDCQEDHQEGKPLTLDNDVPLDNL